MVNLVFFFKKKKKLIYANLLKYNSTYKKKEKEKEILRNHI